jgi:hypothetical protein
VRFRIRRRAGVYTAADVVSSAEAERVYAQFLCDRRATIPADLWRFFRTDFFHDGRIESIGHSNDFGEVSLRILCPNIKRTDGADFEFVNALFDVQYLGVKSFLVESDDDRSTDTSRGSLTYSTCEIETATEVSDRCTDGALQLHSLIIDAEDAWLTLVFEDLRVDAVEPLAFDLICADRRFEVPWASE